MMRTLRNRSRIALSVFAVLTLFTVAVYAGPPLLCFPYDIGGAKSLPFIGDNWRSADPSYDIQRLADDTLALLQPGTPVIVRMETMRRAAVYSMKDRAAGVALLERVEARVREAEKSGKANALALFDLGYLQETYNQTGKILAPSGVVAGRDGYPLIMRAIQLRGGDTEMEFAAAIVQADGRANAGLKSAHFKRALAGAAEGSLLAKNLVTHAHLMQLKGNSLGDLRAQLN